jgi:hypothetical protein
VITRFHRGRLASGSFTRSGSLRPWPGPTTRPFVGSTRARPWRCQDSAMAGPRSARLSTICEASPKDRRSWCAGTTTMTATWIPGPLLVDRGPVTWIVATTCWNDAGPGPWLAERVLRVETLLDAMPAMIRSACEQYWRYSAELDELELANLLMLAPPDEGPSLAESGPQSVVSCHILGSSGNKV